MEIMTKTIEYLQPNPGKGSFYTCRGIPPGNFSFLFGRQARFGALLLALSSLLEVQWLQVEHFNWEGRTF